MSESRKHKPMPPERVAPSPLAPSPPIGGDTAFSSRRGIRRVGIIPKLSSERAIRTSLEVAQWLLRRDLEVHLHQACFERRGELDCGLFDAEVDYDLVVVLGGDGTLLSVARVLKSGTPILGANLGNLGFLTEAARHELYPSLVEALRGNYNIEERRLFDLELVPQAGDNATYRVFNDVVIAKSALARIVDLTLRVDQRFVATISGDGMILSTPNGSTAYNLSAGGPIVHPQLPVVIMTPICPHTLTLRPIVIPEESVIEVELSTTGEQVFLTLDGQEGLPFEVGDVIRLTPSAHWVRLVRVSGRTFYDNLRGKLRWGE